ncbi:MAG: hypothetical protein MUF21_08850 [Gemmatimonadaceae bacterium]|nr:hypothetical protein [Gemmatimonadaceae bacterium]
MVRAQRSTGATLDSIVYRTLLYELCRDSDGCAPLAQKTIPGRANLSGYLARELAPLRLELDSAQIVSADRASATAPLLSDVLLPNAQCGGLARPPVLVFRGGGPTCQPADETVSRELAFSAVLYNRDRTAALVFVSLWCGLMCGHMSYYALQQTSAGRWAVVHRILLASS